MGKNIFRIFNPAEPKQDPREKRRGQLRQAQQTYRDRKSRYTRGLEKELARSRAHETQLSNDCDNLKYLLWTALDLLTQHGIELTPELSQYANESWNCRRENREIHSVKGLTAVTKGHALNGLSPPLAPSAEISDTDYLTPFSNSSPEQNPQHNTYDFSTPPSLPFPGDVVLQTAKDDAVVVGMEFVLKIEEPCLHHIHGDPSKPDEPNWHAMTATSQILDITSTALSPSTNASFPSAPDTEVSKVILDRLSSLAPSLSDTGQITPVQAWSEIRRLQHSSGFSPYAWRLLASRLKETAKCYGFGAVIERSVFEQVVNDMIVQVPSIQ